MGLNFFLRIESKVIEFSSFHCEFESNKIKIKVISPIFAVELSIRCDSDSNRLHISFIRTRDMSPKIRRSASSTVLEISSTPRLRYTYLENEVLESNMMYCVPEQNSLEVNKHTFH